MKKITLILILSVMALCGYSQTIEVKKTGDSTMSIKETLVVETPARMADIKEAIKAEDVNLQNVEFEKSKFISECDERIAAIKARKAKLITIQNEAIKLKVK